MALKPNSTVYFELKGRTLEAARELRFKLRQEANSVPDEKAINLKEFYENFAQKLEKEFPELLDLTGLRNSCVQVLRNYGEFPRAYETCPAIFLSPEKDPRYFMSVPVDYKGKAFQPLDSTQLDEAQKKNIENLLFAGGWLANSPLVPPQKKGVSTPADDTTLKTETLKDHFNIIPSVSLKCFVAWGRTYSILHEITEREEKFQTAFKELKSSIEEASKILFPAMLKGLPDGEELRTNVTYSYPMAGGKTNIELSVCRRGRIDIMDAGKRVPLIDNPYFAFTHISNERYAIHPKGDTPESQEILTLFNALPEKPGVAQYPELHMPAGISPPLPPHTRLIGDLPILIYTGSEAGNSSFCPPGSIPISTALYEWINEDLSDRETGILPPPMPESLKVELSSLSAKMKNSPGRLPGYDTP